jgi:acetylornithine deacetylase/succinyl-diaminopimelate desuccinylase-like protein
VTRKREREGSALRHRRRGCPVRTGLEDHPRRRYRRGARLAEKNTPAARALCLVIRKNNRNPRLLDKGGTADFNLAIAWNCPMAAYGLGVSKLDHTSEEHISLKEYHASLDILRDALPMIIKIA